MSRTTRRPDYQIKALNKNTEETGYIGAAWLNPEGHISIKFNPFVVVPTSADFAITLFPNRAFDEKQQNVNDEIPF